MVMQKKQPKVSRRPVKKSAKERQIQDGVALLVEMADGETNPKQAGKNLGIKGHGEGKSLTQACDAKMNDLQMAMREQGIDADYISKKLRKLFNAKMIKIDKKGRAHFTPDGPTVRWAIEFCADRMGFYPVKQTKKVTRVITEKDGKKVEEEVASIIEERRD